MFQAVGQFDTRFPLARSELGELFEGEKLDSQDLARNVESAASRIIPELHRTPPLLFLRGKMLTTTSSSRLLL